MLGACSAGFPSFFISRKTKEGFTTHKIYENIYPFTALL
jgi:hypothetical protein